MHANGTSKPDDCFGSKSTGVGTTNSRVPTSVMGLSNSRDPSPRASLPHARFALSVASPMLPDAHPNPTGPTARGPSASIRHPLAGRRPIVPIRRRDRPSGPDPGEDRTPPPVSGCAPTALRHPLPLSATALRLTHTVSWRRVSHPMPGRPVTAAVGSAHPLGGM